MEPPIKKLGSDLSYVPTFVYGIERYFACKRIQTARAVHMIEVSVSM